MLQESLLGDRGTCLDSEGSGQENQWDVKPRAANGAKPQLDLQVVRVVELCVMFWMQWVIEYMDIKRVKKWETAKASGSFTGDYYPAESAFFDLKWRESFLQLKSFTTLPRTA